MIWIPIRHCLLELLLLYFMWGEPAWPIYYRIPYIPIIYLDWYLNALATMRVFECGIHDMIVLACMEFSATYRSRWLGPFVGVSELNLILGSGAGGFCVIWAQPYGAPVAGARWFLRESWGVRRAIPVMGADRGPCWWIRTWMEILASAT